MRNFKIGAVGLALALCAQANAADLQGQIDELEERLDAVELSATLNKVKFGLDFNTSVNNFKLADSWQAGKMAMGLYLNMNADINSYTKFTGRLSMTKAFGDLTHMTTTPMTPLDEGRGINGASNLYVERAYVDIYMGDKAALTLGRLPGTDGPGTNLRNGSARMATYPALLVNALGDGGVLTLKPFSSGAIRLAYAKIYQPLFATEFSGAGSIWGPDKTKAHDANLWYAGFETSFLPKSAGKSLLMLSYAGLMNYSAPNAALLQANPGLAPLVQDEANPQTLTKATNLGNIHYANLHLESDNFLGSNLHWFASFTYSTSRNQSNFIKDVASFPLPQVSAAAPALFNNKADGFAYHLGLRYDFGKHFKLGYEYFEGNKNWYAFSRVSINDPLNIRNTRGKVNDVYAIFQIDMNQFFRLSYTNQYNKYATPSLYAQTDEDGKTIHNVALSYLLRF